MSGNVIVYPGASNATHDISLSDGVETWGLKLHNGPRGIQEIPQTPSTLRFTGGQGKFGDYEPGMSHIEQRTWEGGRGLEEFVDDPSRYFDNKNGWTLTPGRFIPAPQQFLSSVAAVRGAKSTLIFSPDSNQNGVNLSWKALFDSTRFFSSALNGDNGAYEKAYAWIRRIGTPGTLTFEIYTADVNLKPTGAALKSATVTTSTIIDTISVFYPFDWPGTQTLAIGTNYCFVISGAASDTLGNHWEVAYASDAPDSGITFTSSNGSTWTAFTAGKPYFRAVDNDNDRVFLFFELEGALYSVSYSYVNLSTQIYINGDQGQAASNSLDKSKLNDGSTPAQSWSTDKWKNCRVRIISGPGLGEDRAITSNTSTALTVTPNWTTTHTTSTRYVIYSTTRWSEITGHGLTGPITDVKVVNGVAYIAQGNSVNIRRIRKNPTTGAHEAADDGTNKADFLAVVPDTASNKLYVWRAQNGTTSPFDCTISKAEAQLWGTNLTFGTNLTIGSKAAPITNLVGHGGIPYVLKTDSVWYITNDIPRQLEVSIDGMPERTNGRAAITHNKFFYFNFSYSLQRLLGETLDDIGPWRGAGLPSDRTGPISCIEKSPAWLFIGIDGGTDGYSSVLAFDGIGWCEIFRAYETGKSIRSIKWQPCPGAGPRLWIAFQDDVVCLIFAKNALNPLRDSAFLYQHETVLTSATIDMGAANLPKFIKEISLNSENLNGNGIEVFLDFQVDRNVGTNNWIHAGKFLEGPEDVLSIGVGNIRQFRYRLRCYTNDSDVPPVVKAVVVEGYARTPVKYQYNLRATTGDLQRNYVGGADVDPDEFLDWLKLAARSARKITMRSVWEQMDEKLVIIEPPTIIRTFTNKILNWWGGYLNFTLREV